MSNLFTYAEALEMALRIELAGEAFYGEALERAEAPEAQELFRFLRDQERVHYAVFSEMLRTEPEGGKPLDEQTSRFMDAAVRDHTLTTAEKSREMAAGASLDELVKLALGFERETIRFFETVKDVARGIERNRLEKIIEEEHGHVRRLETYRGGLGA
jgi:rubrerythrin